MTATWTVPKTWAVGELVTASNLNTHLRNNMEYLRVASADNYRGNESADITTSSTTFIDIDSGKYTVDVVIEAENGDILVCWVGAAKHSGGRTFFDITRALNGGAASRIFGDDGATAVVETTIGDCSFSFIDKNLAPGTYTYVMQWKTTGATGTLYSGAGTANGDTHPDLSARRL